MGILLNWGNANASVADGINIYRAESRIPLDTLPSPIATLPGSATSYEDTTVARGKVYHYRVGVYKGDDLLVGPNQMQGYFPNSGPGPQSLKAGDWTLGYFGRVSLADFATAQEMVTLCGVSGTVIADTVMKYWNKFIRNGKIIFAPCTELAYGMTWQQLYNLGLVYGVDGFGTYPTGVTSAMNFNVNQKKLVTVKGSQFLVRLPQMTKQPLTEMVSGANVDAAGTEWLDLHCRSAMFSANPALKGRWNDEAVVSQMGGLSQHWSSATQVVAANAGAADTPNQIQIYTTSATIGYGWLPFLELQYS